MVVEISIENPLFAHLSMAPCDMLDRPLHRGGRARSHGARRYMAPANNNNNNNNNNTNHTGAGLVAAKPHKPTMDAMMLAPKAAPTSGLRPSSLGAIRNRRPVPKSLFEHKKQVVVAPLTDFAVEKAKMEEELHGCAKSFVAGLMQDAAESDDDAVFTMEVDDDDDEIEVQQDQSFAALVNLGSLEDKLQSVDVQDDVESILTEDNHDAAEEWVRCQLGSVLEGAARSGLSLSLAGATIAEAEDDEDEIISVEGDDDTAEEDEIELQAFNYVQLAIKNAKQALDEHTTTTTTTAPTVLLAPAQHEVVAPVLSRPMLGTVPFNKLPSVGSWCMPIFKPTAAPVVTRVEEIAPVAAATPVPASAAPVSFRCKPSVGTWMQPVIRPKGLVVAAPAATEVAPAPTPALVVEVKKALACMPSVATWALPLPKRRAVVAEPNVAAAAIEEVAKATEAAPAVSTSEVLAAPAAAKPFRMLPSVGTWMAPHFRPTISKAPAQEAPVVSVSEPVAAPSSSMLATTSYRALPSVASWMLPKPRARRAAAPPPALEIPTVVEVRPEVMLSPKSARKSVTISTASITSHNIRPVVTSPCSSPTASPANSSLAASPASGCSRSKHRLTFGAVVRPDSLKADSLGMSSPTSPKLRRSYTDGQDMSFGPTSPKVKRSVSEKLHAPSGGLAPVKEPARVMKMDMSDEEDCGAAPMARESSLTNMFEALGGATFHRMDNSDSETEVAPQRPKLRFAKELGPLRLASTPKAGRSQGRQPGLQTAVSLDLALLERDASCSVRSAARETPVAHSKSQRSSSNTSLRGDCSPGLLPQLVRSTSGGPTRDGPTPPAMPSDANLRPKPRMWSRGSMSFGGL